MARPRLFLVLIVAVGFLAVLVNRWPALRYRAAVLDAMTHARPGATLYHRPAGASCARGFVRIPRGFSVGSGRGLQTWDACWNGEVPVNIDFFLPGESVAMGVVVSR